MKIDQKEVAARASKLGAQRRKIVDDHLTAWFNDLADWFNAERQIQQEICNKELQPA